MVETQHLDEAHINGTHSGKLITPNGACKVWTDLPPKAATERNVICDFNAGGH